MLQARRSPALWCFSTPGYALCQRRTECSPRGAGGQTCDAAPGHTHAITVSPGPPKTPTAEGTWLIFLSHVSVLSLHHQLHPTLLRPKAREVFFTTREPHNSSGPGHGFSRIFDVSPGSGPFGELIFHVGGGSKHNSWVSRAVNALMGEILLEVRS